MVPKHAQRCSSAADCNGGTIPSNSKNGHGPKECITPGIMTRLLRIKVSPPYWELEEDDGSDHGSYTTVLWSGPRDEVWEQG